MLRTRNIIAYRFNPGAVDLGDLDAALGQFTLQQPGPLELERVGFISPVSDESDILVRGLGQYMALALGINKKMIPASVVNERVKAAAKKIAEKENRKVGGKERKRIKEDVLTEMLRTAFVKSSSTRAWIDAKDGWVLIDASSTSAAELVISMIRKALGSFPAVPVCTGDESTPAMILNRWLSDQQPAEGFAFGDECVLITGDGGSSWAGKGVDLCGQEVEEHLSAGGMPTRLGLALGDRLTFTLDHELKIRKLKLTDVVFEEFQTDKIEDQLSEFDAHFALITGEVSQLMRQLAATFDIQEVA